MGIRLSRFDSALNFVDQYVWPGGHNGGRLDSASTGRIFGWATRFWTVKINPDGEVLWKDVETQLGVNNAYLELAGDIEIDAEGFAYAIGTHSYNGQWTRVAKYGP